MHTPCKVCHEEFVNLSGRAVRCPNCRTWRKGKSVKNPFATKEEVARRLRTAGFVVFEAPRKRAHTILVAQRGQNEPVTLSVGTRYRGMWLTVRRSGRMMYFDPTCVWSCKGCVRCILAAELNHEDITVTKSRQRHKHGIGENRIYTTMLKDQGRQGRRPPRMSIANLRLVETGAVDPEQDVYVQDEDKI